MTLVLSFLACSNPGPVIQGTSRRLIAEQPQRTRTAAQLLSPETVAVVPLDDDRWRVTDLEILDGDLDIVRARVTGPTPGMAREFSFSAAEVDVIRVRATGPGNRAVRLAWAAVDQHTPAGGRIELRLTEAVDGWLTFSVAEDPAWHGRITTLKIVPVGVSGERFAINEVITARLIHKPDPDACEQPLVEYLDLDHDVRPALIAAPSHAPELSFVVPEGAHLRFGFAAMPRPSIPVEIAVTATSAGAPTQALFRTTLEPSRGPLRWRDERVDLSGHAGLPIVLRFETRAGPTYRGAVAWANPVVVAPRRASSAPNIILVLVDTLRADHVSACGYERPTTPNLTAAVNRSGVSFHNTIAPSPWTKPSILSLFTGLDALSHGLNHNETVGTEFHMLAERLRAAGYTTTAVTGGVYLHPRWGFMQGFDRYQYWPDANTEAELRWGVSQVLATVEVEPLLPFFIFFHTYEVHAPYRFRQPWYSRFASSHSLPVGFFTTRKRPLGPATNFQSVARVVRRTTSPSKDVEVREAGDLAAARAAYDSGIAYTDAILGRLLQALEERDLADSTVVVVTSDHGEALGEHGMGGHTNLYDPVLKVPLVFLVPDGLGLRPTRRHISDQVRLIDVPATILDLVGEPSDPNMDGRSLVPTIQGAPGPAPAEAWSYAPSTNFGVALRLENRYKLIFNDSVWAPLQGRTEFYDLVADPEEANDLSDASDLDAYAQVVQQRLRNATGGVVIGFRNERAEDWELDLEGRDLAPTKLKSLDMGCDRLQRTASGALHIVVPKQRAFEFTLRGWSPNDLVLSTAFPAPLRLNIPAAQLEAGVHALWTGARWTRGPGPLPADGTGVAVHSRQGSTVDDEEAVRLAEELRGQLRTLGYVE